MSSPARTILPVVCVTSLLLLASACKGKEGAAPAGGGTAAPTATASTPASEPLHAFTGDTAKANAGRLVFLQHNCYSCHGGLAGGAMGPSLRDSIWKYGGTDSLIFRSIHDGRPMGMPAWGNQLSTPEIDELVAYIHSLRTPAEPQFFFWSAKNARTPGKS